ncbi:MAG: Lon-like protease helical domain-containing protein, partial [Dehalococcoidia bacterium]
MATGEDTFGSPTGIRARLRVPVDKLTTHIDERELGFTTTQEVSPLEGTIGQDRALRALEFGLGVDAPGFNIYLAGIPGSGRNTTLESYLREVASSRPVPNDWAYVYNFRDSMQPRGLSLPPGMAHQLSRDMDELVREVRRRVPRAFESEDFQRKADEALEDVHRRHRELTEEMVEEARRRGVGLALTDAGVIATPLGPDGEPIPPDKLRQLSTDEGHRLQEQQHALQEFISQRMTELRALEREAARVRHEVTTEVADFIMQTLFAELRETYAESPNTVDYLAEVREDMIENIQMFMGERRPPGMPSFQE